MLLPNHLMSARHIMPNVRTERDYRTRQRANLQAMRRALPNLPLPTEPWDSPAAIPAFVSGGTWLVECACGNCPAVEPAWNNLACCYECGAVHTHVVMPEDAAAIEQYLVQRRSLAERHWNPTLTIEDLRAINQQLGVGVPA